MNCTVMERKRNSIYYTGSWGYNAGYLRLEEPRNIQVLLEANGLAAGKDHQFKGRYDAEKNAVIISLEKDEQSALSPQKCTTWHHVHLDV